MRLGDDDFAVEMGGRVRRARRSKGFTQDRLASEAGLHRTSIGLIENGLRAMELRTMVLIVRVLGVDPTEMLDGVEWIPGPDAGDGTWSFARPVKATRTRLVPKGDRRGMAVRGDEDTGEGLGAR
jgi:transcriptional regulator with XRE-family HTH domain